MTIHVVTKVGEGRGNLASALGQVWLDPQASGGSYDDPVVPLGRAVGQPLLEMYVLAPVFRLGELLVLLGDRDQLGRKPSKWDVELEAFDTIAEAAARAREVAEG